MVSTYTDNRVIARLKPAQLAALDRLAVARGVTRTDLIKEGVGYVLAEENKEETEGAPRR
jgi:hypothetical protein